METNYEQNDIAGPLPAETSLPIAPHSTQSTSELISTAIKDGISAALERLGITELPGSLNLNQVVQVTKADITTNWGYPEDPKGERAKRLPWVHKTTRKKTDEPVFKMIIRPGFFNKRLRPQGSTYEECVQNGRKLMLKEIDIQQDVDAMTDKDRRRFLTEKAEIDKESLGEGGIWEAIGEGKQILKARKDYNIPAAIDMVALAIRFGRLASMDLTEIVQNYFQYLDSLSHNDPTRTGNYNHQNDRAIIRRLAKKFKDKGPLSLLMADIKPIEDFYREEIHDAVGPNNTKEKNWSALRRFFAWLVSRYHFTPLDETVMGKKPKVEKADPREVPGPDHIEKFLNLVLVKYPTFLPMAVMVVWVARPEESWNLLEDFWTCWRETFIRIELSDSKKNTVDPRSVRVRPCVFAWMSRDPRFASKAKDLRPLSKKGKPLSYQQVEKTLRAILKESGWSLAVRNDKEYHRKGFISAQIAVGNDEQLIINEAGHADDQMLDTYNKHWPPSKGYKYFDVWPPGMKNIPTKNLHQPFGAKLEP